MGVDTKGRLKGKVLHEEVLNFIKQKFDKNAKSYVKIDRRMENESYEWIKEYYSEDKKLLTWCGFINFEYKDEKRKIFYYYSNYNSYENLEYYKKYGLEDMVKSETTYLSLGCWGNSVEIMKEIVTEFGGWIDENDCDDEEFYSIEKDADGNIKPVFHVSMSDIYDKFGGVVIIDKKV